MDDRRPGGRRCVRGRRRNPIRAHRCFRRNFHFRLRGSFRFRRHRREIPEEGASPFLDCRHRLPGRLGNLELFQRRALELEGRTR
ncbi:MAG TPA: hypothetical protein VNM87_10955, partial [Candidatus Udaeobacter sp.]|nr:hypothetical protein [Candidatus Udaeobacter sp.]